ncbi:MAG: twin transmembrane helix small protein [Methylovulum sp.]|uniref:twin transmembrane helix small protein n=1 Tax=Methylovulum sp. TaxID=1916980 RepID=UPI0026134BC1|nr:twin transmembrane helix small protein [Methylovulum sp.]MDD2722777.1 twin transmembrane helix small protein [Methylovulum sp.]MDD5124559.1 twin transmembrane helix small protein [Methylovulum sp.]
MIIKSIAIFAFALIIISLGIALFNLIKDKNQEHSEKIVKALTFRISLSVLLFIFIFIALATGILKPHGIGAQINTIRQATPALQPVK